MLLGTRKTPVDLSTFHPSTVDIFKLWQIYLDNVNPLLKVTHAPTVQVRIIEAVGNISNIPSPFEALLFSIYCMAIFSIEDEQCLSTFATPKSDLLTKYQFGCQQALTNAGFLRSADRDTLTALYLYLVSYDTFTSHTYQHSIAIYTPPLRPSLNLSFTWPRHSDCSMHGHTQRVCLGQAFTVRSGDAPEALVVACYLRRPAE